jgi:putative tryptophan/tyrosine transport system permease protein
MSYEELLISFELGIIYGIVAIGIYITFRVIDFPDLSCDGSFVLGAAVSSVMIKYSYNPWIALLCGALAGAVAGGITSLIHIRFKISDLLSGILVAFMLYSINLKIMGGIPNISLIDKVTIFSSSNKATLLIIMSLIISSSVAYILLTDWGLALRSISYNKRLALNVGVRINKLTAIALIASNALIAFSGGLFSQHQEFVDISQGTGTIIIGLAAVIIGERITKNNSIWVAVVSCIAGSIIYRIFISLALYSEILGLQSQDLNLITGLLVIIIMIKKNVKA